MAHPKILYGTAWKQGRTTELVVKAVLQGFRGIDTACHPKHYREDLVGNALEILYSQYGIAREQLFIQTKFTPVVAQDRSKPLPYDPRASVRDQILASIQVSLKNLRTTYLDSYLLHCPLESLGLTVEAWTTLMELQDSGKVRTIGVSNFYEVETLVALNELRKAQVIQNRWYEGNDWDKRVSAYCLAEGIRYQSFWTLTGSPSLLKHPSLIALATITSCTPAQAIFKLAQVRGIVPLAGSNNEDRMEHGVEVETLNFDQGPESARALEELEELIGGT